MIPIKHWLMLFIFAAVTGSHSAIALDLVKGIGRDHPQWNELTSADRAAGYYPKAVVSTGEEGIIFTYDGSIGKSNHVTGELLGGWPLTRWEHEFIEPRVVKTYRNGFHYSIDSDDQYVADSEKLAHLMGCMQQTPLRYGDLDGDGQPEIVLFLADEVSTDLRVFSPTKQKVIFSSKLNFTDAVASDQVPSHYLHESNYQYLSWRETMSGEPPAPAIRAYGKLYFGDFDDNGSRDILVWRKLYETHMQNEEEQGFKKTAETLFHYRLVDGEYLPQETAPETIQSWLTAHNLRWPDGYPRESECPGEEGQLIVEMHDALLNDPDVLPLAE